MIQITGTERQILFAEEAKESFESMTLGLECVSNLNRNTLHPKKYLLSDRCFIGFTFLCAGRNIFKFLLNCQLND
jgi:hypothetical protein